MKRALAVLALLCICAALSANDGAVRGVGGTVSLMDEHPSVRMVSEKVDIKLGYDSAKVRCEFVFENDEPPITVKMGFPEKASSEGGPIVTSGFLEFRSWVDGQPIMTEFIPSEQEEFIYQAWHVKDVPFDEGQIRTVINEYTSPFGRVMPGNDFFSYILKTGKSWKGTIGEAVITIDSSKISKYVSVIPTSPKGAKIDGDKITWQFNNFEPQEDVFIPIARRLKVFMGEQPEISIQEWNRRIYYEHGITVVPIRYLRSYSQISWNNEEKECKITYFDKTLLIRVGSKTAVLNDTHEIELFVEPYIERNTLYAPIVAIANALGMKIGYDPETGDLWIYNRQ